MRILVELHLFNEFRILDYVIWKVWTKFWIHPSILTLHKLSVSNDGFGAMQQLGRWIIKCKILKRNDGIWQDRVLHEDKIYIKCSGIWCVLGEEGTGVAEHRAVIRSNPTSPTQQQQRQGPGEEFLCRIGC